MMIKAYDSAYAGSMVERKDGDYVRRDDPESLAEALVECVTVAKRRAEDLEYTMTELKRQADAGSLASVPLFDVVDIRTGHVPMKAVPQAGALSAADTFNRDQATGRFVVFPTGTYKHEQEPS